MADRKFKTTSTKVATRPRNAERSVSIMQKPVSNLPHERDESADSQGGKPRKVIKQAGADLKRGQQDTDRSAEMNQTYWKLKVRP